MRAIFTMILGLVTVSSGTLLAQQPAANPAAGTAVSYELPTAAPNVTVAGYPVTAQASDTATAAVAQSGPAYVAAAGYPAWVPPSYTVVAAPPPAATEQAPDITMDQVRDEIKKLAWVKGEMKIVPYGSLWGSAIYHTHRTQYDAYTLWVLPFDQDGQDDCTIDTRRTRLGLDVTGPKIPALGCGTIGGKVEIDFMSDFFYIQNKPTVLLRHAYGEVKNEDFRLLAGQTWDVVSPLYPGDLSYSVLWDQGNIGYRRAQIRLERYYEVTCEDKLTVQLSANENILSDFATSTTVYRQTTGWPLMEGRVAWTVNHPAWAEGPVTLGTSGHIGQQQFDFAPPLNGDVKQILTWSGNLDLHVPLTRCSGFQGEFFNGSNLGTMLGGIGQGVSTVTHEGIRASGGWVDFWHDWTTCWHSHVGFGVDDPLDRDVRTGRSYNEVYFANMTYDITKFLIVGLEVTADKTKYITTDGGGNVTYRTADSVGLEFTGQYKF
jgi:hypothetical protein